MDETRLDRLVHYACARCQDPSKLGATKLNKVLWYSDVLAFAQDGQSLTGSVYVKRQFGPVPKNIMAARARLVTSGAMIERTVTNYGLSQIQFITLTRPDISMFSASQISLVDSVLEEICANHTATSISNLSHDVVWESAEIGEEIPLAAAAFGGNLGELDEDDMSWARKEISRIERTSVSA